MAGGVLSFLMAVRLPSSGDKEVSLKDGQTQQEIFEDTTRRAAKVCSLHLMGIFDRSLKYKQNAAQHRR